jgi:hypothetical protein
MTENQEVPERLTSACWIFERNLYIMGNLQHEWTPFVKAHVRRLISRLTLESVSGHYIPKMTESLA